MSGSCSGFCVLCAYTILDIFSLFFFPFMHNALWHFPCMPLCPVLSSFSSAPLSWDSAASQLHGHIPA